MGTRGIGKPLSFTAAYEERFVKTVRLCMATKSPNCVMSVFSDRKDPMDWAVDQATRISGTDDIAIVHPMEYDRGSPCEKDQNTLSGSDDMFLEGLATMPQKNKTRDQMRSDFWQLRIFHSSVPSFTLHLQHKVFE